MLVIFKDKHFTGMGSNVVFRSFIFIFTIILTNQMEVHFFLILTYNRIIWCYLYIYYVWIVIEKWFVQPLQTEDNDPKVHDHIQQLYSIKQPGDLMTHALIIICIHLVCNISQTTQFSV